MNGSEITEVERATNATAPVNVQAAVWQLLHRHSREVQSGREDAARDRAERDERLRDLVVDLSRAHFQLRTFLERQGDGGADGENAFLATIRDGYEQVLARAGVRLEVYTVGTPYRISDPVRVVAWIPVPGVAQPRIRATVSPEIWFDDRLVAPAEVEVEHPAVSGGAESEESTP